MSGRASGLPIHRLSREGIVTGGGSRVVDIAEKMNLSRPAVSHHMQILKDAGIVKTRKEGTCVYYYLDPDEREIGKMIELFSDIRRVMKNVPNRSGQD